MATAARKKPKPFEEDAEAIRATARALLALENDQHPMEWTEWELDFLEGMAQRTSDEPLSEAQAAKLEQLGRLARLYSTVEGLSIALLIASAMIEVEYLEDEESRAFIRQLRQSGTASLRHRQAARLLRCCRELGVIEGHQGFLE